MIVAGFYSLVPVLPDQQILTEAKECEKCTSNTAYCRQNGELEVTYFQFNFHNALFS